jgi:hypothetical protein
MCSYDDTLGSLAHHDEGIIHRSAWKGYSPKFGLRGFSEVRSHVLGTDSTLRAMSTPPNATARPLARLVDRLGTRPAPGQSDGRHWRSVLLGTVLFAVNALPDPGWVSSPADEYARLLALCLGPILVSQGASGLLLRRGKETLSLWFSVLQALLTVPLVALGFLLLYEWVGLPWAVGVAAAVCAVVYAVRWKRLRQ